MIDRFEGENAFLSNFYRHQFRHERRTYSTAEHAFQAAKCVSRPAALQIRQAATPGMAKRMGRRCTIRPDWDLVKVKVMEAILRSKFSDPVLREMLNKTAPQELVEGNYWGDRFWGVYNGIGHNHLGKLLMKVRDESPR